jgi:hypothetical protein
MFNGNETRVEKNGLSLPLFAIKEHEIEIQNAGLL